MSGQQFQKIADSSVNILQIFAKEQTNEAPLIQSSIAYDKSLNLQNNNSLALMARYSIENGIPIPKNMLSFSQDAFQSQEQSQQQKQSNENDPEPQCKIEEDDIDDLDVEFLNNLNIQQYIFQKSDTSENTKNVLRNFGNAQNHYILYNKRARQQIKNNINRPEAFDEWVRSLKLQNFQNFKQAWGTNNALYKRLYKQLCWNFYTENAVPYVLLSRIKKPQTRNSHLRYIFRFLEGLQNPQQFTYFRKQ